MSISKGIFLLKGTLVLRNADPCKKPTVAGGCGRLNIGKYGQSHALTVRQFLTPLARHASLQLFVSEVTHTEGYTRLFPADASCYGCPHSNQTPFIYWSSDETLTLPGLTRLRLPNEEAEYGAYSSMNLAYTSTTNDAVNLPESVRRHFEPGKVICEPLALMTETVTTLSICDRLPDLELLDFECLADFANLTTFELHEHYRLKTKSSKLTRVVNDILSSLTKNVNLSALKTLNLPVHRDNIQSTHFCALIKKCTLRSLSLVGFANDKRNSSRLQVIAPVDDTANLCLISTVKTLERLELVELPSTQTGYIAKLATLPNLKTLALSWIGLFGSFNWKYDLVQFFLRYKQSARVNRLVSLKLCQAALALTDPMIELLPSSLVRLVLSNTNRPDPSFINAKHIDHGAPIQPAHLARVIAHCPRLRLFLINPTGSAVQLRMAARSNKVKAFLA